MCRADVLERELTEAERERIAREEEAAWREYERKAQR